MATTPVLLQPPETRWVCSKCTATAVTHQTGPHTQFHQCRGLKGLTAPMTVDGEHVDVRVHEREDYIGSEVVTVDGDGRPAMSVEVVRNDGTDLAVYAPMATVEHQ